MGGTAREAGTGEPGREKFLAHIEIREFDNSMVTQEVLNDVLGKVARRQHLGVMADSVLSFAEFAETWWERVSGHVVRNGQEATIKAGRVVLAAGTYGSPAILIRSGSGPCGRGARPGS